MRRIVLAVACLAALLQPVHAQDERVLDVSVREKMSLLHEGKPVVGARVAFVSDGEGPAQAEEGATRTDAAGAARLTLPDGAATMLVWKAGSAPAAYLVERGGKSTIALDPARRQTVLVRGPTGDPLPGVGVAIDVALPLTGAPDPALTPHRFRMTAVTDAQGTAVFEDLPEEPVAVEAGSDAHLSQRLFPITPGEDHVTLDLIVGATVAGRVTKLPSGRPAEGAVVSIGESTTVAGPDGSFELGRLQPGATSLRIDGEGFVPPRDRPLLLQDGRARRDIAVEVLETATLRGILHLSLPPGAALPAPGDMGATFRISWPPGSGATEGLPRPEPREFLVQAGLGGGFEVRDLPPADGVVMEVRREGFVPVLIEGLALRPGRVLEGLWIELDAGGALEGTVADPNGQALLGVRVLASTHVEERAVELSSTVTGEDGSFRLAGMPSSDVYLDLIPSGGTRAARTRVGPFNPRRGETTDVLRIRLDLGVTLRAVVAGAPEDAEAFAYQGDHVAGPYVPDSTGLVELPGLSPGTVRLVVRGPRGGEASARVELPSPLPTRLLWEPRRMLTLTVVDGQDRPAPRATVAVEPAVDVLNDPGAVALAAARIDATLDNASGRVSVELVPGRWRVTAQTPDGGFGTGEIVVPIEDRTNELTVVVGAGEVVRGHVFEALSSSPVEGARVSVLAPSAAAGASAPTAITDERGWFAVHGVAPAVIRLRVEADGFAPEISAPIVVRAGTSPLIGQLELRRGARVVGRVTSLSEPVPAGASVGLRTSAGDEYWTTVDVYGRFEFSGIPAGKAVLALENADGDVIRQLRIDVSWSDLQDLLLELDYGTRAFGVVRTAGRPEPFARVVAHAPASDGAPGEQVSARSDAFGRFRLPPLPPGPVTFEVTPPGHGHAWTTARTLPDAYDSALDLDLPEGWIAGTVVEATGGGPVSGAFVRAYGLDEDNDIQAEAVSGEGGVFRLDRLPAGRYELEVTRAGFGTMPPREVSVPGATGLGGVALTLPGECIVAAQVLDLDRRPLPGGWLLADPLEGTAPGVRVRAAPDGAVLLRGLAPGSWSLSAGAPGKGGMDLGVLALTPGRFEVGEIHLDTEAALDVRVAQLGLIPMAGAEVTVEDALGRDPRPARRADDPLLGADRAYVTGSGGRLLVRGLRPGIYRVGLAGTDDATVSVRLEHEEIRIVLVLALPETPPEDPGD